MGQCILCNSSATINKQDNASRTIYNCQNCGVFVVSDLVVQQVKQHQCELAAYFTNRKLAGHSEVVLISYEKAKKDKDYLQLTVEQILSYFPKSFSDQMDLVLQNLTRLSTYEGEEIRVESLESFPIFLVKKASFDALSFVIKSMQKFDLLEVNYYSTSFFPCSVIVSPKGWDRVSQMEAGQIGRNMALILRSEKEKDSEYSQKFCKVAKKAVRECGFHIMESNVASSDDKVNYEMIALIKGSCFVVSDMSEANGAAYFTAGMAQALGKINILTCHTSAVKNLEIDCEQISVLSWKDEDGLYLQILNAVRALVK